MSDAVDFSTERAHKYFSAQCFNKAWDLIDKTDRTAADDEQMLLLSQAALWHWTQRPDCTDKNLSIGYWQQSRIHALLGDGENARKAARSCLDKTPNDDPFLMGYAYEALCRAELVAGNSAEAQESFTKAEEFAEQIADKDSRELLQKDLDELKSRV